MPKSQFVDFKAVKSAITMQMVLEHYGLTDRFKKSGDSLSGPCPIHKGSNPTQFRISVSKNLWKCFSECHHGGNVLDFIVKMEDVSIHAAALKAIEWFDLNPEDMQMDSEQSDEKEERKESNPKPKSAIKTFPPVQEKSTPNKPLKFRLDKLDRSHPYLTERGLTQETIIDFGLGFCAKGVMADRIAIPIHNVKGKVMAYAGRWPGEPPEDTEKYKLPPGFKKSLELFNIDRAIKEPADEPLIIVEGFFDAISLHQHGCRKVVAVMGSSISDAQVELIREHTNPGSQIIIMFDEDEAGRHGRNEVAARLAKVCFVKVHVFSKEGMQPEHFTAEEVQAIIGGAK